MTNPTTRELRTPDDVAAHVVCVMGFHPDDSLVILTFGSRSGFHARVELPKNDGARHDAARQLLAVAQRNRTSAVLPVLYTADERGAQRMLDVLEDDFSAAGIRVLDGLRIADGCWFAPDELGSTGQRLELEGHPFVLEMMLAGRELHSSRAALAASLARDPEASREVLIALALRGDEPANPDAADLLLRRHLRRGTVPSVPELAGLYLTLESAVGKRQVRTLLTRHPAREHLAFWPGVVRSAPATLVAEPLAVLGLAAWLGGNGAMGWCAVDRLADCAPRHPVLAFLAANLAHAIRPSHRSLDALTGWGEP